MKPEKNLQTDTDTDTNPDSNPDSNTDKLFNTEPLLNELNTVIQTGMKKLLGNYITNYKLYEETHNCIMNLPSVKREIAKKFEVDETYDDLPELISISSDEDSEEHNNYFKNYCDTGIKNVIYDTLNKPIEIIINDFNDNKKESDIMLKLINDLLKEKKEVELFNKQQEETYKKIIETCDKEIEDLKNQINNCVKQSLDHDLTFDKQEKENIILHIEENSDLELDLESDEEEDVEEDAESEEEEVVEEKEDIESEEDVESEEEEEKAESEEEEKVESEEEEKEEEKAESEEEKTELSEDEVETEEEKDEEEEEELFEIEIDGVTYCTENEDNGFIYVLDKDGNVGETTGYLKNGEPFFN